MSFNSYLRNCLNEFQCVFILLSLVFFFFFKQNTAYEMRISDWSSDVCSSDLPAIALPVKSALVINIITRMNAAPAAKFILYLTSLVCSYLTQCWSNSLVLRYPAHQRSQRRNWLRSQTPHRSRSGKRSEVHTSELQSLMRISYAVFCLKKKKKK